jgi:hypothetical protein
VDLDAVVKKWKSLSLIDRANQRALTTIHVITDDRIFKAGKDANLKSLGKYSEGYMRTRKRGVLYISKGKKRKITYPSGTKIILQATSQMNNDFKFLVLPGNKYGSGFSFDKNYKKSLWVESTYSKDIFKLAKAEDKRLSVILEKELQRAMNKL